VTGVALPALAGSSPLGFLAALGALSVADRSKPERHSALRWTEALVPSAVLTGPESIYELLDWAIADLERWLGSALLGLPAADIKPPPLVLHDWLRVLSERERRETDLFAALLAEGAQAGNNASKPTHLHFTAGQQQFLAMVRTLAQHVDRDALEEALRGPWRYESTLPTLGWDVRGERVYALRGFDPSKEKRNGVPGADWLAFLGLTFLPVFARDGKLVTTGCEPDWKSGSFVWPIWDVPLSPMAIRSLLAFDGLRDETETQLRARGIFGVLQAPIHRSDQGGYGSFRAPQPVERRARLRRASSRSARPSR